MEKYRIDWAYGKVLKLSDSGDSYEFFCKFVQSEFENEDEVIVWLENWVAS